VKNLLLALDSGAYSLYNLKFAADTHGGQSAKHQAEYDYVHTAGFKEYMENYIAFLHKHKAEFEMYVGLDIIYNHKATIEVQEYMESCGLDPMPVFHHGEPFSVLEDYIDKYDYVGVGGLGQRTSVQSYIDFGDKIFERVCDKHGRPQVKVHGFAMTSVQLMTRYPWYSCDSSTWTSLSRNGWARFPRIHKDGSYDFLRKPISWRFTERSRHAPVHISKQSELAKSYMERYLQEMFDFTLEDVTVGYFGRDVCNAGHTFLMSEALKGYYRERWDYEEGANVYIAGHPGCGMSVPVIKREFTWVQKALKPETPIRYLASHFYPKETDIILDARRPSKRRKLK